MTARELIQALNNLGEENLDKKVIMFDGPAWYTPYKVKILTKDWGSVNGKILID